MSLVSGTRIGPYEIADEIGAGGMGVVYRATDTNLKRDVAVKVLPGSLATDEERLTRFQREAELLASLNHSNIAQVFGLEKLDGATALVMELVDGPTLEDRIQQGAIPPDEALGIAMQIAEALEGAHGQGIVHRDLKPANIKLRPDGTVKVLDFGIAKALEPDVLTSAPQTPMMTTPATQIGVVLGTAAYMSPEQARGKQVDQRADIWAFGCVLYEMLTGQPAFGGEDVTVTLARVVERNADYDTLPAGVSPAVRNIVELCLKKDLRQRVADIRDVRLALEGAFETTSPDAVTADEVARPIWAQPLPVGAAAVIATCLVAWGLWPAAPPPPEPQTLTRFYHDLSEGQEFRVTSRNIVTVSRDGNAIAYNTTDGLYLRELDELEARAILGTGDVLVSLDFSPDGQFVAYYDFVAAQLSRVPVSGGAPVTIVPSATNPYSMSWAADDTLLISVPQGIMRVPASGGTPELVIPNDSGVILFGSELLPDGESVLFSEGTPGNANAARVVVESLSTGERSVIVEGGIDPRYLPTGHVTYAFEDTLFVIPFDVETLAASGGAVPVAQGLMRGTNQLSANYDVSNDGTLVYVTGPQIGTANTLVWVDREGREESIDVPPRSYLYAQLSPDGTRVALDIRDQDGDIWIWDLERETLQRLTFDTGQNRGVSWSPDGQRVAFSREIGGSEELYWQAADGSGAAEPLTADSDWPLMPNDLTPDGALLIYMNVNPPRDLYVIPVDGPPTDGRPLLASPANEDNATVSPDGRWLAYESTESGQGEVYVRPFPEVDTGRWQISTDGGTRPRWSRDGTELFYYMQEGTAGTVVSVPVELEPTFRPGAPDVLFQGEYLSGGTNFGRHTYDVSLDGQRFLMIKAVEGVEETERTRIVVVENWFEELERLAPTD